MIAQEFFKDASIRVHDRNQFEIKIDYPLNSHEKVTSYQVDAFFFIPYHLNINQATYKKTDFINGVYGDIRFKTPKMTMGDILTSSTSPLHILGQWQELGMQDNLTDALEYHIKMFGCIMKSTLRDYVEGLRDRHKEIETEEAAHYACQIEKILRVWRLLKHDLDKRIVRTRHMKQMLQYTDEYVSYLVEEYSYRLVRLVENTKKSDCLKVKGPIMDLLRSEISYRKDSGYPVLPEANGDNEQLIFRRSVLKKHISNILFLTIRSIKEPKIAKEAAYAVAAGCAMIFATVIAFLFQKKYGDFTLPFFIALVVGYMFKDRLKDFMRNYIQNKFITRFYDIRTFIYDLKKRGRLGVCSEMFRFVRRKDVPAEILRIRNMDHITSMDNEANGENILTYKKVIRLYSKRIPKKGYPVCGLSDIMRFNVAYLLKYMDDPVTDIYVLNDEDYQVIPGKRVYHVNIVLRFCAKERNQYRRLRLVLDKNGIKRIETQMKEEYDD